ncbi:MAG: hydroxymethylglutaryl-CoA reductase, degradative [Chloroflexota bacterium]|nr:MAG: hydroxymethylglutaryl-CoA reductase, degradative [Chloroflexota bacterium]
MAFNKKSSRIAGFYVLPIKERQQKLVGMGFLDPDDVPVLSGEKGLSLEQADNMIENVIGRHALPVGVALNFLVNGRDVLIPMAVEEPSIVAGASYMAKLARRGGGFQAQAAVPEMIGQLQILGVEDVSKARLAILEQKEHLLAEIANIDPVLTKLGGGPKDIEVRVLNGTAIGNFLVVHLIVDVRDAMGANAVNTACERLAPHLEEITGGRVHLRILSNLADKRLARASCTIPLADLAFDEYSGPEVRDGIIAAWAFADADPYRAATHNKGILNGVDAVVLVTGNDWRAVEAGAHAYAVQEGRYRSLSTWGADAEGNLVGVLEMPLAVGIVGGATRVHPVAQKMLKLMEISTASELAEIIVSAGLAQNLAALRALATEGIQKGHMTLHARQVAISAGASGKMITRVAQQLVSENAVRLDRAQEVLKDLKSN